MVGKTLLCFILVAFISFATNAGIVFDETDREAFNSKRTELGKALDNRNFSKAKSILKELFPLIKKDIKEGRKEYSRAEKANSADLDDIKRVLSMKNDLYESMKSLVDVSTVALRARSDDFKLMIDQYGDLMSKN